MGSGEVRRLLPQWRRRTVGPFAFLDVMGPEHLAPASGIDVDAHPHIGLATLTYLLAGELLHRDSLGSVQLIGPGAVNWMTAGEGVCHTERTPAEARASGSDLFGVQTWVALPEGVEDGPAAFEHCDADAVPVLEDGGARVRLAAGTGWGQQAPIAGASPLVLADVTLAGDGAGDAALDLRTGHPELAILALDGSLEVDGATLAAGHLAVVEHPGEAVLRGQGRAVVLGGEPVGPRHIWWNFVHSDPARIEDAKQRWRDQAFPLVPGDHDRIAPLPEPATPRTDR